MAEEQGQVETQPALEMNEAEARQHFTKMLEKVEEKPRDETGKFVAKEKEEAPKEEAEAPAEETTEAPEEVAEEAPVEKKRYKLKYKGEELEKDEDEVVSLAQQGFDYTQKSQALAKEKEETAARIKSEVEAKQRDYEARLETYKKAVEKMAGVDAVDLNKLALEDPTRAQQEFFKQLQFQQTLSAISAEQQKIAQQRQTEFQESMKKQALASLEKLEAKIPGWGNDLYGKVLKYAVKEGGFEQKEVNAITDHRAIEVLHKAMKYDELMQAKPKTVDKKVAAVPKVTKPGTVEKSDPKASKLVDKRTALSKSGSRDDAVAVFAELMNQGRL